MRKIYDDTQVSVTADDNNPDSENSAEIASHLYTLSWEAKGEKSTVRIEVALPFQKGPVQEAGVNGISNEALLAIVADRLASFQHSKYACTENEMAFDSVCNAMIALQRRTISRKQRGVQGTSKI